MAAIVSEPVRPGSADAARGWRMQRLIDGCSDWLADAATDCWQTLESVTDVEISGWLCLWHTLVLIQLWNG